MRALGVASGDIEAHLERTGYGKDADVFELWEEHVNALTTFHRCQMTVVACADGRLGYLGIAAREIESVALALRIEFNVDLIDEVQTIAQAAAAVLNNRK